MLSEIVAGTDMRQEAELKDFWEAAGLLDKWREVEMDFHSSNAIVTGGSSGIGKATARMLVQRGANVAIIARRQVLLDAALAEFEAERVAPAQVFQAYSADLSDWEQVQAAIAAVISEGHTPDILINAAGIAHPGYFEELPIEVFRRTMDVDFFGTFLGDVFLYDQHSVLAAEAKGVDHGRPDRLPPGFVRYIVQVALRIGVF